jgi:hypothetical protein
MCTVLLPPGGNLIAVNRYIKWFYPLYSISIPVAISLTVTRSEPKGPMVSRLKMLTATCRFPPPPHTCSLAAQENGTDFVHGKQCVSYSLSYCIFTIYLQDAEAFGSLQTKAVVFL